MSILIEARGQHEIESGVPKKSERTKKKIKNPRLGRSFDDYLKEKGTYEKTTRGATKLVLAATLKKMMKEENITKVEMARRLETSRSQLDRLLDPKNENVTLASLISAARVMGCELIVDLGVPNKRN